jgi:hypothetical protein
MKQIVVSAALYSLSIFLSFYLHISTHLPLYLSLLSFINKIRNQEGQSGDSWENKLVTPSEVKNIVAESEEKHEANRGKRRVVFAEGLLVELETLKCLEQDHCY